MPYEFTEWGDEPEPQTSSARSGRPPQKRTGIGILDPPGPLKRLPGAIRILALCGATVCGVYLVAQIVHLLMAYNYVHHRLAPGLLKSDDFAKTVLLALGFTASAILYGAVARSMRPTAK